MPASVDIEEIPLTSPGPVDVLDEGTWADLEPLRYPALPQPVVHIDMDEEDELAMARFWAAQRRGVRVWAGRCACVGSRPTALRGLWNQMACTGWGDVGTPSKPERWFLPWDTSPHSTHLGPLFSVGMGRRPAPVPLSDLAPPLAPTSPRLSAGAEPARSAADGAHHPAHQLRALHGVGVALALPACSV